MTKQPVDASLSYSDQHKEEGHSHGCFFFFFFLVVVSAMWDLSSLTGVEPACPAVEVRSLNPWTPGKSSLVLFA